MFCCTLLYVQSCFAIILMGKRELVALLSLSSWCLIIDVWLFLAMPWVCLRFVIVVFPDHTHYLLWILLGLTSHAENKFSIGLFRLTKWSIFVYSTMRNAPYVYTGLDSILELCRTFLNEPNCGLDV